MRKVGKMREGWKVGKRKKVKGGKVEGGRWEDRMWKVERLKSWKRDKMKERGGQGERMTLGKGIKQEKGMRGSN
jgi:hypothetical protein